MRQHTLTIIALIVAANATTFASAAEYWIAPDGDDTAAGTSRESAWASPSRGQPSRTREGHAAGDLELPVYSTHGFLPTGNITVAGTTRAYSAITENTFVLEQPFDTAVAAREFVFDADILDGDSFAPGAVINLAGGTYVNRPLWFCSSGTADSPIIYRSADGERALLVSKVFSLAPIRRLGSWRYDKTEHFVLENISVRNQAEGNHGAGGIELYGVANLVVDGCDVDISGRDINGDNDGIKLFGANDVVIRNCRVRSRMANGIMAWQSSRIDIENTVVYESFNGIQAAGNRFPAHLTVDHCTVYAINTYGAINAEKPGTVTVTNSIITQVPSTVTPAMRGSGSTGDFNNLWHVGLPYGNGWNGRQAGAGGTHDIQTDPQFISRNPNSPHFLRIPHNSVAARAGRGGTYIGAFPPVARPAAPKIVKYNVQDFGAVGDGATDDLPAIKAALAKAKDEGGGKIIFPPTNKFYLISDTIHVRSDWIHLYGPGATIKLKNGAGRMDVITIGVHIPGIGAGPVKPVVEHIKVEGFVVDGSYRTQPQARRGNNPRGLWSGNAHYVTLKNLRFEDTFCGVTFGPGSRDCEAIGLTVTDWDHDAYGASGRGVDGGCTDIRFINCRAVNAPRCVKAWEIEEGAARVYLEDCEITNLGGTGTGYYVRHHEYHWPLHVDDVTFVRCTANNLTGNCFIVTTTPGTIERSVKPNLRTRNVRLIDCQTNAPVIIACGVEDVLVQGSKFENLVSVGFETDAVTERDARLPVRSVTIKDSTIQRLKINARTGNANAKLGAKYHPDYEPRIRLENVHTSQPPEIIGTPENVTVVEAKKKMMNTVRNDPLELVVDNRPSSTIVVADDADWWQRMAAGWLQEYVEQATGAELPIVRESDAPQGTLISVGHTKRAADAGIQTDDLQWDGCRLAVRDDVVFLLGRDGEGPGRGDPTPEKVKDWTEGDPWRPDRIGSAKGADLAGANGTCKAVVTFLEDVCGVRWFMPVEQGIVVPRSNNVAVPRTLNKVVRPVFAYANGSFLYGTPRLYPSAYANNFRFGIRLKTYGGHSWNSWVHASLFKEHPEYFALRDGKRTAEGNHVCTTNPKVRDRMLRELRELFDKGYDWVQIGQSDGWKHCECDSCEAMDNFKPYDPEVNGPDWWKWLLSVSRENPVERIHLLHNWVAEQAAISHPDKKVHYLAYIPTRWPSKQIDQYSPNVVAELCHEIPEMLDAWSDKVPAMTIYRIWWDMSWVYGYGPDPTPKEVADEIRNLRDYGVIGIFNGGEGNCWGLNGPVFYVMGKTIGDPDLDENDLVNEYCHGVYGEAGEQMNAFFQHLYRGPARINKPLPEAPHAESLRARFPPRLIAELEDLLGKAEAVGVSGHAADNLRMTRIALDYLRLTTHMWGAYEAFEIARTSASLAELRKHVDAFEDFRHMILHMDPDDAERRFPDWGHFCKWLTGSHYWDSWHHVRKTVDLSAIRGKPVGFYAKIRKPLTLDFDALEMQMNRGDETDAASFKDEAEAWEAEALEVALRVETDLDD